MQYRIEGGSLPAVIINLNPGETILSEVGGRTWSRGPVLTETKAEGGAGKALGRMFMGESLFMNRYTAQGPAEIAFSSSFPGRIVARELAPGQSIVCQKRAFLCGTYGIELAVHFQKKLGAGLVGGSGPVHSLMLFLQTGQFVLTAPALHLVVQVQTEAVLPFWPSSISASRSASST